MTLAAEQAKAEKRLVWLLEIELGHRIEGDTWTQDGTYANCFWMNHAPEGKPSRVRAVRSSTHALSTYTEQASLSACNSNAGSWYYDPANGRLYLHTTTGGTPASGFLVCSHFWRRFADSMNEAPDELAVDGIPPDPRLAEDAIPDVGLEIEQLADGGVKETWGDMELLNGDGGLDADLGSYIWHLCVFLLKVGAVGDAYANLSKVCRGRTGSVVWTEDKVTIGIEDQLRAED